MENRDISFGLRAALALERGGIRPSHALGQNFILDEDFLSHLLDLAELAPDERVLEIGPGPGLMTALMAARAREVVAVEMDEKLEPVLRSVLSGAQNVRLVVADALKTDLGTLMRGEGGGDYRVVANLPYYITADLILKLLETRPLPRSICVMVQREAAERLMSAPGEKNWGALAATVRFYGACEILEAVPPQRFNPPPHVESSFIRIRLHDARIVEPARERDFLRLLRGCFAMRRKTLANNLKALYGLTQAQAQAALAEAELPAQVRGEALELEQIARLSAALKRITDR